MRQLTDDLIASVAAMDAQLHPSSADCAAMPVQACAYDANLQLSHIFAGAYALLLLKDDLGLAARLGTDAAGAVRKARCWLGCALQFQDLSGTPSSAPDSAYGKFAWDVRRTVSDDNAVEFSAEGLSRVAAQFAPVLGEPFWSAVVAPHLPATLLALARHVGPFGPANRSPVAPSYTNIYLGNLVAQILTAEALGDARAEAAYAALDAWLARVRAGGVAEYDSPFYYQLDLSALELGYLLAARKPTFRAALDYFWADIAANTFHGELSGSHSRNYDFLRSSSGGLALDLFVEGLRPTQRTQGVDLSKIFVVAPRRAGAAGYRPAAATLALAQELPRWVRSRVGGPTSEDPAKPVDRSNYVTAGFALGSSSQDYTVQTIGAHGATTGYMDQDRIVSLAFAAALPDLSLNVNTSPAAVYGGATADASGHVKTHHVAPVHPTTVQDRGALLVLLDLDPRAQAKPVSEFTTNLVLPFQLSVGAGGDRLETQDAQGAWLPVRTPPPALPSDPPGTMAVPRLAAVAGWSPAAGACFAVRFFHVDTARGAAPAAGWFTLRAETLAARNTDGVAAEFGWKQGAMRLALTHFKAAGPPEAVPDEHLLVGLVLKARACATRADLAELEGEIQRVEIDDSLAGAAPAEAAVWRVAARWPGGPQLAAEAALATRTTVARSVGGQPLTAPAGISVNGRDLGL